MTRMIGLSVALAIMLTAIAGCAQGTGENKARAKSGDNNAGSGDVGPAEGVGVKHERPKMATREDWKNVPKDEGPRLFAKLESKAYEGTLRGVDATNNSVTVEVGGQAYTLRVSPSAFIEEPSNRSYALRGGLSALGAGNRVLIQTVKEGDQDVVTRLKLLAN